MVKKVRYNVNVKMMMQVVVNVMLFFFSSLQ